MEKSHSGFLLLLEKCYRLIEENLENNYKVNFLNMPFWSPISRHNYCEQFSKYFNIFSWSFVCLFIHFFKFIEWQPNSGTVLCAGVMTVKKADQNPCPRGAYNLVGNI